MLDFAYRVRCLDSAHLQGKSYPVQNAPLLKDLKGRYFRRMVQPVYHLHLDAAYLPPQLLDRMIQEGGYHLDDFPHQLELEGKKVEARHLTRYLYGSLKPEEARSECLKLISWARETEFKGLIQCEFVMEEAQWNKTQESQDYVTPPFVVTNRQLTGQKGDQFKKHEAHLEIDKQLSSSKVINALRECGFHILENDNTITFTASGPTKEMLLIRNKLKEFLHKHGTAITGKLTYEATALWSLHGIESATLPTIVDKVTVY